MEAPGKSQGTWILLLRVDANRKYRDFKQVALADPPTWCTHSPGLGLSLVPDEPQPCWEKANSLSPTAPAQVLHSQLHKQGGETAKKYPVWLLFKYRTSPGLFCRGQHQIECPGAGACPPRQYRPEVVSRRTPARVPLRLETTCRWWSTSSGDETTEQPERCWQHTVTDGNARSTHSPGMDTGTSWHCSNRHCSHRHCSNQHCSNQHCSHRHCSNGHCSNGHCSKGHCSKGHCLQPVPLIAGTVHSWYCSQPALL